MRSIGKLRLVRYGVAPVVAAERKAVRWADVSDLLGGYFGGSRTVSPVSGIFIRAA